MYVYMYSWVCVYRPIYMDMCTDMRIPYTCPLNNVLSSQIRRSGHEDQNWVGTMNEQP